MIVNLVNDLLWNNKEEGKQEKEDYNEEMIGKEEDYIEVEAKINGGSRNEGIEENGDGKEEMIEGCIKEEEDMNGEYEEKSLEKQDDLERMEKGGGLKLQEERRKGEELWLEMWGKEMERREREREKERREIENQRSQV